MQQTFHEHTDSEQYDLLLLPMASDAFITIHSFFFPIVIVPHDSEFVACDGEEAIVRRRCGNFEGGGGDGFHFDV